MYLKPLKQDVYEVILDTKEEINHFFTRDKSNFFAVNTTNSVLEHICYFDKLDFNNLKEELELYLARKTYWRNNAVYRFFIIREGLQIVNLLEEILGITLKMYTPSVVEQPKHYNTGEIECIQAIESSMSALEFAGYCKGNVLKYVWRYRYKEKKKEDLKKAEWYLKRLIDVVEKEKD